MCGDTCAIERGESGHCPHRLSETTYIGSRQKESQITSLPQLVDIHQSRGQDRTLVMVALLKLPHTFGGPIDLLRHCADLCVGFSKLLGLDLTIEFQSSEVAEQRLLLGSQPLRFALKGLKPFAGLSLERLG